MWLTWAIDVVDGLNTLFGIALSALIAAFLVQLWKGGEDWKEHAVTLLKPIFWLLLLCLFLPSKHVLKAYNDDRMLKRLEKAINEGKEANRRGQQLLRDLDEKLDNPNTINLEMP